MTTHAVATLDDVITELRDPAHARRATAGTTTGGAEPCGSRVAREALPALGGAFGSAPFASRDLLTDTGVRVVVRGLTVKQIGQLLARSVGTPINGLVIERAGSELSVCLWRVGAC